MNSLPPLNSNQRRHVIEALQACQVMQTPESRNQIVGSLTSDAARRINRLPNTRQDVESIVTTCSNYPGALEELLDVVNAQEGNSYSWQKLLEVIRQIEQGIDPDAAASVNHRLHQRCNRSEQREAFEKAFEKHFRTDPGFPLICIVHGDELECHGDFVTRVKGEILSELYDGKVTDWLWVAPSPRSAVDRFWLDLGKVHLNRRFDSAEQCRERIQQELVNLSGLLLVHLEWLSENFEGDEETGLANFIQFWEAWHPIENCRVVCVLSLKYQQSKEKSSGLAFWRKPLNKRLREWVTDLHKQSQTKHWLVVLPELHAVKRHEAEEWSKHRDVLSVRDIRDEVSDLFRQNNDNPIRMKILSGELKKLLEGKGTSFQVIGQIQKGS